jgi:membrane protein implicated in regulation of membrane protease activity
MNILSNLPGAHDIAWWVPGAAFLVVAPVLAFLIWRLLDLVVDENKNTSR